MKTSTVVTFLAAAFITAVQAGGGGSAGAGARQGKVSTGNKGSQKGGKGGKVNSSGKAKAGKGGNAAKSGKGGKGGSSKGGKATGGKGGNNVEKVNESCKGGGCNFGAVTFAGQSSKGGSASANGGRAGNGGSSSAKGNGGKGGSNKGSGNGGSGSANGGGNGMSQKGGPNTNAGGVGGTGGGGAQVSVPISAQVPIPMRRRSADPDIDWDILDVLEHDTLAIRSLFSMDDSFDGLFERGFRSQGGRPRHQRRTDVAALPTITKQNVIDFAMLLMTNPAANADFVQAMNTNTMLHHYMAQLDPTIRPQGQITSKEIQKCVDLLASNDQAQTNLLTTVNSDASLAQFLDSFKNKFAGLHTRGLNTWEDVDDILELHRRWDDLIALELD